MHRRLRLIAVLLVAGLPAAAQGRRAADDPTALARWQQLSPQEREALRTRFEAFQHMDASQQAELRARFERLRATEQRVRGELEPELEGLSPRARREFLREQLASEFNRCGERLGELLPPELRARLELATPAERRELLQQLRAPFGAEKLARGLQELGRRLEFTPEELSALADLEPEAQRAKLLELRRRELVARVEREGPPSWIGAERWQDWVRLDDREFCARLHARRGEGRGEDAGRSDLGRLLRPDPTWFDELAALEPDARRAEFERRTAARLLDFLAAHPERLAAGELERLRALPPAEVLAALRERLRAARVERGERRGPPREHGGGGPPPDGDR